MKDRTTLYIARAGTQGFYSNKRSDRQTPVAHSSFALFDSNVAGPFRAIVDVACTTLYAFLTDGAAISLLHTNKQVIPVSH